MRGQARIDGVSALITAGLTGWDELVVHVSVPEGTHATGVEGIRVHRTRYAVSTIDSPLRAVPEWAALHAAAWATSDRAATTLLAMAVQQRITTAERIRPLLGEVPHLRRSQTIRRVIDDIAGGAQALSEIDFARLCRQHGIPEPTRQASRRGPGGRIYLDALWPEYGVSVEVDGFQHGQGEATIDDALRDNAQRMAEVVVIRIPVLGLRTRPRDFLHQLTDALRCGGWSGQAPPRRSVSRRAT